MLESTGIRVGCSILTYILWSLDFNNRDEVVDISVPLKKQIPVNESKVTDRQVNAAYVSHDF